MLVSFFSSNIPLYIGKNPAEKLCKVLEMELKTYTPVGLKFFFEEIKFKVLHHIVSFVNAQGLVKIRLACSKALLLTISSTNTVTHSNGCVKGDKYFFFYKSRCGSNVLLKLNHLQRKVETQYIKIIFIPPSNIKNFIERSCVTYFLEGKKWLPSGFSVFDGFYSFFS